MEAERIAHLGYWSENDETGEEWESPTAASVLTAVPPPSLTVVRQAETAGRYTGAWKRVFDVALGLPLFLASLPVILLAGVAVALTSGWPVFYKTRRLGADGREFTMWKLRTMVKDADAVLATWRVSNPDLAAEYEANFKLKEDPRITPVGRFLRRTSIDELPQFLSVLRGQMSLVGPRPYYAWELTPHPQTYETIVQVRPGVTGPWQVAGRNSLSPAERMFLDRTYVNTCSFRDDVRLLIKTAITLLRPNGC
jgi:lipopolysaccharide/colanic/teichoic acid biosynthesis glycosyltransferase